MARRMDAYDVIVRLKGLTLRVLELTTRRRLRFINLI